METEKLDGIIKSDIEDHPGQRTLLAQLAQASKLDAPPLVPRTYGEADLERKLEESFGMVNDAGEETYFAHPQKASRYLTRISKKSIKGNIDLTADARLYCQDMIDVASEQLAKESLIDPLTGAYNRRAYDQHLPEKMNESYRNHDPLALFIFDIDKFKAVNDSKGHRHGDEVLKKVTRILQENTRAGSDVYRIGGDELALIAPKTNMLDAARVAERCRTCIDDETDVTVSIGIASYNGNDGAQELYEKADSAAYRSKILGRNQAIPRAYSLD